MVILSQEIFSMTYRITTRVAYGKKAKHHQVFKKAIDETSSLLGGFCSADLYPSIRLLLKRVSMTKSRLEKHCREIDFVKKSWR